DPADHRADALGRWPVRADRVGRVAAGRPSVGPLVPATAPPAAWMPGPGRVDPDSTAPERGSSVVALAPPRRRFSDCPAWNPTLNRVSEHQTSPPGSLRAPPDRGLAPPAPAIAAQV